MNNNSKRLSSTSHLCATCSHWMGPRTTDSTRTLTEVVLDSTGDCHDGNLVRKKMHNNASCPHWEKWGGVK